MNYSEADIKNQCRDYLRYRGIFFYHNLQGLGCYPGLPDMVMHYPCGELPREIKVAYLEFKTAKGKLSANQEVFQTQCKRDGIDYWIIRSLEDLIGGLG